MRLPLRGESGIPFSGRTGGSVSRRCVLAAALSLPLCLVLEAQTNTGGIRGAVYDTTGGIIPGVEVTAIEITRGVERTATTSETGDFVFTYVETGTVHGQLQGREFRSPEH